MIKHYCKDNHSEDQSRSGQSASNLFLEKEDDVPKLDFRSQVHLDQGDAEKTLVLPNGPWDMDDMYCNSRLKKPNSREELFLGAINDVL